MMGSYLMIYGIGTDITKVSRFEKWVKNEEFIKRFFNSQEIMVSGSISAKCEHYAARFAVKEAFSKALGTGISGFNLQDVFITNDKDGKPKIHIQNNAKNILENRCGECNVMVSLSHEKEFAIAFVVIECL